MPVFIMDMKHSPEMCPMFNDKVGRMFKEQYNKIEEIADKLEIKILINLGVFNEHYILIIVEAPSIEAVESFIREMKFFSFNNITLRHAQYSDDIMKGMN